LVWKNVRTQRIHVHINVRGKSPPARDRSLSRQNRCTRDPPFFRVYFTTTRHPVKGIPLAERGLTPTLLRPVPGVHGCNTKRCGKTGVNYCGSHAAFVQGCLAESP
jgi:hypothetical protein